MSPAVYIPGQPTVNNTVSAPTRLSTTALNMNARDEEAARFPRGSPSLDGRSEEEEDDFNASKRLMDGTTDYLDLESGQRETSKASEAPAEYAVSTERKLLFLGFYFTLSLTLTIYSKLVLGRFGFPYLLTALHASVTSVGCYILMLRGYIKLARLGTRENLILVAFSSLFTINIAISNVSLSMVSVPFHQIMRSMCPIFTVILYRVYYSRTYPIPTYLSMLVIILGVALVTYGDYQFTPAGFLLTFLGVLLASIKTVVSNRLMTGTLALPALEILLRMSPLAAFQSLLYAFFSGEIRAFILVANEEPITASTIIALQANGLLAFLLNISSFYSNKMAGALTITICANLKQCLTVLLGIVLFDVKVGVLNAFGMIVTLAGAAWYSKVELTQKTSKPRGEKPAEPSAQARPS